MEVRQSGDELVFMSSLAPEENRKKQQSVFVEHAFRRGEPILVTLTSSNDVVDMYVNGVLKESVRNIKMQGRDFAGTLIVANAPDGNLSWKGTFRGLAFYDHALGPNEINEDYDVWQHNRQLIAR